MGGCGRLEVCITQVRKQEERCQPGAAGAVWWTFEGQAPGPVATCSYHKGSVREPCTVLPNTQNAYNKGRLCSTPSRRIWRRQKNA